MSGIYRANPLWLLIAGWLVAMLLLARMEFHVPVYVSISTDWFVQVYRLSHSHDGDTVRDTQSPPADYPFFFILNDFYGKSAEPLHGVFSAYFRLPAAAPPTQLRLELFSASSSIEVRNICLHHRRAQQCWNTPESIAQDFAINATWVSGENHLIIHAPHAELRYRGDKANLDTLFAVPNQAQRVLVMVLLSLVCLGLALLWHYRHTLAATARTPWRLAPQHLVVIFGLGFGLSLVYFNPILQGPDEYAHAAFAFSAAQPQRDNQDCAPVPVNAAMIFSELYVDYSKTGRLDKDKLEYFSSLPAHTQYAVDSRQLQRYSFFPYLPAALGIRAGLLLDLSWLDTFRLARLASLLTWLVCAYLAIRLIPVGKWLLLLLALSPMSLFQAAVVSADNLTLGLSFVVTALAIRLLHAQGGQFLTWLGFVGSGLLLALSKMPYLVLMALALLKLSQTPRRRYVFGALIILILITMTAGLLWATLMAHSSEIFLFMAKRQLNRIIEAPWLYLEMVGRTLYLHGGDLYTQFIGTFGWLEIALPRWLLALHGVMLLFMAVTDNRASLIFTAWSRLVLVGVTAVGVLAVCTALYFIEIRVINSESVIDGLQGRYFIPLALPLLLALQVRAWAMPESLHARISLVYLPFSLATSLFILMRHYYV
jgi:uncharacterized membrane protein